MRCGYQCRKFRGCIKGMFQCDSWQKGFECFGRRNYSGQKSIYEHDQIHKNYCQLKLWKYFFNRAGFGSSFIERKIQTRDILLWIGLFATIVNGILGNIIVSIVLSSISSRPQVDAVVQGIYVVIHNLQIATHLGGIIENLVDKILSTLISCCVYFLYTKINNSSF